MSQLRAGAGEEGQTGKGKRTEELLQLASAAGGGWQAADGDRERSEGCPCAQKGGNADSGALGGQDQNPVRAWGGHSPQQGPGWGPSFSQAVCLCPHPPAVRGAIRQWGHAPTVTETLVRALDFTYQAESPCLGTAPQAPGQSGVQVTRVPTALGDAAG